ncbi:MAG: hypothetical protein MJZ37_00605 [Bacilli bacterium]|nr:hypothetical protein [Bacilli bacterium]
MNNLTKKREEKTEWTSNAEKRQEFIDKFGEKKFDELAKEDPKFAELQPLPFPEGFTWLFNHFYKIWRHCETDINGNRIFTPRQIIDYCQCFGVTMNFRERAMVLKMKEWAVEAIVELKKEKEKK